MNTVNLIGRLCGDPETRYTTTGTAVANVNLAVDDGWGENKKTLFIGLTIFGKTAEIAAQHCVKGQQVGISGRLSQDTYTLKGSDKAVTKTHVTVERLDLLAKPKGDGEQRQQAPSQRPQPRDNSGGYGPDDDDSSEIPFASWSPPLGC